jgi:nucleotide-binding universal stress UspA family protein
MKKLLVALDSSARAPGVLGAALAFAERVDAQLILVRATGIPGELPVEAYASDPEAIGRLLEQRASEDLLALAATVPKERLAGVRGAVGTPWQIIDAVAREEDVDVIVIGAHGYGRLERFLGTVAAQVVNHADRSVLVIR